MGIERPARSRIRVRTGRGAPPSVDGHPGWVEQSVRQYAALYAAALAAQGFLLGAGPVLAGARSAAWWCTALGALAGALCWLPLWGLMRGRTPRTLDEAFREAYGKWAGGALSLALTLMMLLDAALFLRAAGSVARYYLLVWADDTFVSLLLAGALALICVRHGGQGLSRLLWLARLPLALLIALALLSAAKSFDTENLFPLLGYDVPGTLGSLPLSAGGFLGVVMLGQLPRQTGSAKPVRLRTGFGVLGLGGVVAVALVMATNLLLPPRAVEVGYAWGHQLMIIDEYLGYGFPYLMYLCVLMLVLVFAAGGVIAAGSAMVQGALSMKGAKAAVLAVCVALALWAGLVDEKAVWLSVEAVAWRGPAAAAALWATWGVVAAKRARKAAA